jgi:TolB-like protein/thioredoxin-like negative regulator of GroEL
VSEGNLFSRLRERKVFRTAGYYILAAWLALQVGDVVVEPAGLPDWSMSALLYLLVFGFPVAVFLGWRYDITENGVVRTGSPGAKDGAFVSPGLKLSDYVIVCLLFCALGYSVYHVLSVEHDLPAEASTAESQPVQADIASIAVLPFADLSGEQDREYLGDGISDTVTHVLSQVEGLNVTARTSSFAFKNRALGIREIAESLGVAHILEGSVQSSDTKVRIIARLINAETGTEVWSGYYDRDFASIFDIQDEIAQEVATALVTNVLQHKDVVVASTYQPDLGAFEQLILGRKAYETGTEAGYLEARERYDAAVALDPDYALAYVMLAQVVPFTAENQQSGHAEAIQLTRPLLQKALDLDPLLPEAHAAQAQVFLAMKEFAAAEEAANRALELSPSFAAANAALADIYSTQSRFEESLVYARKAAELDPEDNQYQQRLAVSLWSLGRSEAAISVLKDNLRRHPSVPANFLMIARYLRQMGRSGEAHYWTVYALELDPESMSIQWAYCLSLLQLWDIDGARQCTESYLERYPGDAEATNYLAHLTGNADLGLSNAREQVEANPNFWYRKMQLADWLIQAGFYEETLSLFRESFPGLYGEPPEVNDMTIWAARNLIQAYRALGRNSEADDLIEAGLAHLERQRKLQGTHLSSGIDDVYLLALQGSYGQAIESLRQAIDRDWQFYSFGLILARGFPEELLADPRFISQVERQSALMKQQRDWYESNSSVDLLASSRRAG